MNDFEQRFMNNENISSSNSTLPKFEGKMMSYNGNEGQFSIMNPGDDLKDAREVKSISFVVDFIMMRLKYRSNSGDTTTSNYKFPNTDVDYTISINDVMYQGSSKKEIINQLGVVEAGNLKQELVYVGYLVNIDGTAQSKSVPVWYVSRGTNSWLLSEALKQHGGLKSRTQITIANNGTTRKNENGGTNKVLDFKVAEIPDDRAKGFVSWVVAGGTADWVNQYRQDMENISKNIKETKGEQTEISTNDMFGNAKEIDINDDDLPF